MFLLSNAWHIMQSGRFEGRSVGELLGLFAGYTASDDQKRQTIVEFVRIRDNEAAPDMDRTVAIDMLHEGRDDIADLFGLRDAYNRGGDSAEQLENMVVVIRRHLQ